MTNVILYKTLTNGLNHTKPALFRCFASHARLQKSNDPAQISPSQSSHDPRIKDLGRVIENDYAAIRDKYRAPKHPIILAHGLFGFDELHIAGAALPGLHYWRGITEALTAKGIKVFTASVPPSASIEERAEKLRDVIEAKAGGENVNIIAGLDSRYMISQLKPPNVKVLSLTTIATPHRGSSVADFLLKKFGPQRLKIVYAALKALNLDSGAFSQLTREYMTNTFNPSVPDLPGINYYSYGASFTPSLWSSFRRSNLYLLDVEGPNDGLVSVESSVWGTYKGTLIGVNHLDLINWTNRLRWWAWTAMGGTRNFNAVAFYLDIADMLAKEDL